MSKHYLEVYCRACLSKGLLFTPQCKAVWCHTCHRERDYWTATQLRSALGTDHTVTKELAETCEWQWQEEEECWDADCGGVFTLNEGTPKDNGMKYCLYCGRKLRQIEQQERNE